MGSLQYGKQTKINSYWRLWGLTSELLAFSNVLNANSCICCLSSTAIANNIFWDRAKQRLYPPSMMENVSIESIHSPIQKKIMPQFCKLSLLHKKLGICDKICTKSLWLGKSRWIILLGRLYIQDPWWHNLITRRKNNQ